MARDKGGGREAAPASFIDLTYHRHDRQVALLALSARDVANLETIRELSDRDRNVRSHSVRIRRLIAREAARLRKEAGRRPPTRAGQLTLDDLALEAELELQELGS
jgi:hypothetical protein